MTDLKKGTKVRIVLEGTLEENSAEHRGEYGALYLDTGIYLEDIPAGAVEVLGIPLPTEPGIYVSGNNRENINGACIIKKWDGGEWEIYGLYEEGEPITVTGKSAEAHIERWIKSYGPLVPLTVAQ